MFPSQLTMLRALVVTRWLALIWMTAIVVFDSDISRPTAAWGAVVVTFGFVMLSTVLAKRQPTALIGWPFIAVDVGLAYALSIIDGYVFAPGHVFAVTQSLATQWPLIAIASAGIAFGPGVAAVAGVAMGPAEWLGAIANSYGRFGPREIVSFVATSIYYGVIGAMFGWVTQQLHRVEVEVADRRARDEVARVLHDTVLQTLALVERRSSATDPALADAAREADRDLRAFLFKGVASTGHDLTSRVQVAVDRARRGQATAVTVNVLDDGCRVSDADQETFVRALGEAVTNAIKHASAKSIVVFVETTDDGQIYASVHDDGVGFDPSATTDGAGISESIVARLRSIGGDAKVTSTPGNGCEVEMWSRRSA